MLQTHRAARRVGAFTLVELLIVIGIIALLIAILLPSLARARRSAQETVCLSNVRQLSTSWLMYADAHRGTLVSASTWGTDGWALHDPRPESESNVMDGALYPYVQSVEVYRCAVDPRTAVLRSYSLSDRMRGGDYAIPSRQKLTQIRKSSETYTFLEEQDPRDANEGSFVQWPWENALVDPPATWHGSFDTGGAATFGFADGHAKVWHWDDKRMHQLANPWAWILFDQSDAVTRMRISYLDGEK